ncbi:MAG: transporter substrate-binding protein [Rhodospirillales bacterium]|jgi:sulfonate transport system substrate-binding protein|nr:transporter substrate-binding protein [Rhodospirillales bacterium]
MRNSRHLLAGLLILPLVLCSAAASRAEPVKIRLAWVVPVANLSSILFAKEGVAKHLGQSYQFEAVRFQGTPPMITALATGDLEIALLAYSTLGLAVQNAGLDDIRIIADEAPDGVPGYFTMNFMVLNDSGIKTVADLKGKVIATNSAGSGVDIAARSMLAKAGLDDKKDLTIVETGFANMKAMLLERKVVFAPFVRPFSEDPELRAVSHPLFTLRDAMGITNLAMLVARSGFIAKNRPAMVDFLEDYLRAVRWYTDPANHAEAVAIAANFAKLPPAAFDGWLFTKKDSYRDPNGIPNLAAVQSNVDTQLQVGFLKAKLDVSKYVDLSLVEDAAKRLN